jgi:hypothetical protein
MIRTTKKSITKQRKSMKKKSERNLKVWEIRKKMKGIRKWRKVSRTYMMPIQKKEQGHMKKVKESNKKI